jgi:polygalacturonase
MIRFIRRCQSPAGRSARDRCNINDLVIYRLRFIQLDFIKGSPDLQSGVGLIAIYYIMTPKTGMMKFLQIISASVTAVTLFATLSSGQLSGSVGPTTSTASKAAKKICNVLDYGAVADQSTDIGPPLLAAFEACSTGGIGDQ